MKDMFLHHYILNDQGNPVIEPDLDAYCKWFAKSKLRRVKSTRIGPYEVSTVFFGLDHNYGHGPPILWETMVFSKLVNDPLDQEQTRCSGSREQAEAMHQKMVELVKEKYGNRKKTKTRKASRL